jgi:hypothetical protein
MIRDKQKAGTALDQMEKAHGLLMNSLKFVKENCPDNEYKAYRAGMAQVLGQLYFLVMEPIYRQHPSLAPPDTPKEFLAEWSTPSRKQEDGSG